MIFLYFALKSYFFYFVPVIFSSKSNFYDSLPFCKINSLLFTSQEDSEKL